jgi:hypothetical protein
VDFLTQLREAEDRVREMGARVVGVSARDARHAQRLVDGGLPFKLLLDPDHQVRRAVGSDERFSRLRLLHPRDVGAYLGSIRQARYFGLSRSEARRRPGLVILDAQLNPTWTHIGRGIGDYPDLEVVLTELRRAV